MNKSSPKILVFSLELHWLGISRLPHALQNADFEVGIACRPAAFLAHTKFRSHFFPLPEKLRGAGILACLHGVMKEWTPDVIVPGDDRAAIYLANLHAVLLRTGGSVDLAELIQHSLGNPSGVLEASSKRRTMDLARELGVRVPASTTVGSQKEALTFGLVQGFPVVLKRSYGSGGDGVVICRTAEEIPEAYQRVTREETLKWRFARWRDRWCGEALEPKWQPVDGSITVSQFVAGKAGTCVVAAVNGQMCAVLSAVVEHAQVGGTGSSSVVRIVFHDEMARAAKMMVEHWKLTGLIGFDFMVDEQNQAWLIECNPRPTPITHLGEKVGENICRALHRFLVSDSARTRERVRPSPELVVAHFPQEVWRDPNSPYLADAFHDVPEDDPELLETLRKAERQ
ncbi:hypothetical protein BH09VER1_BH09VER1_52110 [soil metagenome]